MKISRHHALASITAICMVPALLTTTHAAPMHTDWAVQEYAIRDFKGHKAIDNRNGSHRYEAGVAAFTSNTNEPGMFIACGAKTLVTRFSPTPVDFAELAKSKTFRSRQKFVEVYINGLQISESRWIYQPEYKVYSTASPRIGKIVAKAASRGHSIRFVIQGKDDTIIDLPRADKAFKSFTQQCNKFRSSTE